MHLNQNKRQNPHKIAEIMKEREFSWFWHKQSSFIMCGVFERKEI